MTTYSVGDIHGRYDLLRKMIDAIEADARQHDVVDAEVVFLGDYIDRGPDSMKVVDFLVKSEFLPGFSKVFLMGNHEDLMLTAAFKPTWGMQDSWLLNGGRETMTSYGVESWGLAPEVAIAQFADIMPESHYKWFNSLRLYHEKGNDLYVHAGIDPTRSLQEQTKEVLLWIRKEFLLATTYAIPRRVIFGHTPMRDVMILPHQIGIDTGAVYRGKLSGVAIKGDDVRVIQVLDEAPQT